MAQNGSGFRIQAEIPTLYRAASCLQTGGMELGELAWPAGVMAIDLSKDWRDEILDFFKNPDMTNRRLRTLAINYVPLAGVLYKRVPDGVLLRCIGPKEAMLIMAEVHEGVAGAHQSGLEKNEVAN